VTTLVYVYAVLEVAPEAPPDAAQLLRGIDGATVRLVREQSIAAAVSNVPAVEFEEEPLNARLADLGWLGPRAMAHQHVNARLFDEVGSLLPLSFGTVFRTDDKLREFLVTERPELLRRLTRIRGRAEWVVAVHREPIAALAYVDESVPEVRRLLDESAVATPGRAYLLRRRLEELRANAAFAVDAEVVGELMRTLEQHAEDIYREPVPDDAAEAPIARASVLVPRNVEQPFARNVEQLSQTCASRGYVLELTGPWPPYRFSGLNGEVVHARR
jgi:hypothetical protein